MENNNEGLAAGSRQSKQGPITAPAVMDRAVRFLIHQMSERDEGVYCDIGMAVRFAASCPVPQGDKEVQID